MVRCLSHRCVGGGAVQLAVKDVCVGEVTVEVTAQPALGESSVADQSSVHHDAGGEHHAMTGGQVPSLIAVERDLADGDRIAGRETGQDRLRLVAEVAVRLRQNDYVDHQVLGDSCAYEAAGRSMRNGQLLARPARRSAASW